MENNYIICFHSSMIIDYFPLKRYIYIYTLYNFYVTSTLGIIQLLQPSHNTITTKQSHRRR